MSQVLADTVRSHGIGTRWTCTISIDDLLVGRKPGLIFRQEGHSCRANCHIRELNVDMNKHLLTIEIRPEVSTPKITFA